MEKTKGFVCVRRYLAARGWRNKTRLNRKEWLMPAVCSAPEGLFCYSGLFFVIQAFHLLPPHLSD